MDAGHLGDQDDAGAFALAVDVMGVTGGSERLRGPSGQVGFRSRPGGDIRCRVRSLMLLADGQRRLRLRRRGQRTVLIRTGGALHRELRGAGRAGQPGGPHRSTSVARHPRRRSSSPRRRPACRSGTSLGVERGDELLLVGVALGQAEIHTARSQIADCRTSRRGRADRPGRCGRRRCCRGNRSSRASPSGNFGSRIGILSASASAFSAPGAS